MSMRCAKLCIEGVRTDQQQACAQKRRGRSTGPAVQALHGHNMERAADTSTVWNALFQRDIGAKTSVSSFRACVQRASTNSKAIAVTPSYHRARDTLYKESSCQPLLYERAFLKTAVVIEDVTESLLGRAGPRALSTGFQ